MIPCVLLHTSVLVERKENIPIAAIIRRIGTFWHKSAKTKALSTEKFQPNFHLMFLRLISLLTIAERIGEDATKCLGLSLVCISQLSLFQRFYPLVESELDGVETSSVFRDQDAKSLWKLLRVNRQISMYPVLFCFTNHLNSEFQFRLPFKECKECKGADSCWYDFFTRTG